MTKQELFKANRLTKQEIAYLDFHYGDAWFKHKAPQMYINTACEALEEHTCPICGTRSMFRLGRITECVNDVMSENINNN